jgi:hypothetical protein
MLPLLFKWFTGGGLNGIAARIAEVKIARTKAETDSEKLEAGILLQQLEARQAVLISEQDNWVTRWIRPAFAFPFIVYDTKVLIWDKVLKLGTTDDLSPEFWQLQMIVFGAYFLSRPVEKYFKRN